MRCYSLLDRKLKEYGAIMLARNDDAMRRSVMDGVRGSGGLVEKYPADFDLYHVGDFNTDNGRLTQPEYPVLVDNVGAILEVNNGEG